MISWIEIQFLRFVAEFFQLNQLVGIFTLGLVAVILFVVQFARQNNTFIPGLAAVFFGVLEYYHYTNPSVIVNAVTKWSETIALGPATVYGPDPYLEPVLKFFVAPWQIRYLHQEWLFVFLVGYIVSVALVGYKEYKKTGVIWNPAGLVTSTPQQARPKRSTTNELGSADLASSEVIAAWTRPSGKEGDTVIPVTDLRGSEGLVVKKANLVLPPEERNRHILAVAKTGSGKTTKLILPILYSDCLCPFRSTIVIDSKPEMWRKLAAMTKKYNPDKNILLFNPLDTVRSLSWNILAKIDNDTDAKLIANTIIAATDNPMAKSDSPFFRNNALAILTSIMYGLLHDPAETLSMPRIHELVQGGMKPLCSWLEAHPEALRNTRTFVELARSGSQNADTIMSELGMRLSAWDLSAIRKTTSLDELDLEEIIAKPTLFIVELRESELEMLRPMANVIVTELLRFLTKRAEHCPGSRLPRPVSIVIDEFASALGRIPDIHVKLNTMRSRNVSMVAAVQSLAQIKANYGDNADSVIAGFNTKIFMPSLDLSDAEWASKETGQMTIRYETASKGSNRKLIEFFASKNDSKQEQVQQRAVLTPDEIGRPADGIATIFLPNTQAFQGFLTPFYEMAEMLKRITEFDSEELEYKVRLDPIELIESLPGNSRGSVSGGPPSRGGSYSPPGASSGGAGGGGGGGIIYNLPPGITDTSGWSDKEIRDKLESVKLNLAWSSTTGSARKWWDAFEVENASRINLVLRLAEELQLRNSTITDFFLAYIYSNTDNIQANLAYLDYTRLKKEEEKKKKEAEKFSKPPADFNSYKNNKGKQAAA